jgi:hypothetical protein
MREFSATLDKHFSTGLRPYDRVPRNTPGLVECYNVKVGPTGIEPYTPLPSLLVDPPAFSWPYLQLFKTKQGLMVAGETNLYEVNSWYQLSSVLSFASTGIWTLADFQDYQVWANGDTIIERDPTTGVYAETNPGYTAQAVCNFRGQLIAAGFDSYPDRIAWGPIGSVELSTVLSISTADARKNTSGFRDMPFLGEIYQVKELSKPDSLGRNPGAIIVYGSGGVAALFATETTFGFKVLNQIGIPCKGAVGGDEKQHIFIDRNGYLYSVSEAIKVELLGYKEFLYPMISNEIMISYDEAPRQYYISDGTDTYLYYNGLSKIFQTPTSIANWGSNLVAVLSNAGATHAQIVTDTIDFQNRGIKQVMMAEVGTSKVDNVRVSMDYLYTNGQAFRTSTAKLINKSGIVAPMIAANDLRFRIRADSYTDFSLDYAILRAKQVDKRSIRGI